MSAREVYRYRVRTKGPVAYTLKIYCKEDKWKHRLVQAKVLHVQHNVFPVKDPNVRRLKMAKTSGPETRNNGL